MSEQHSKPSTFGYIADLASGSVKLVLSQLKIVQYDGRHFMADLKRVYGYAKTHWAYIAGVLAILTGFRVLGTLLLLLWLALMVRLVWKKLRR